MSDIVRKLSLVLVLLALQVPTVALAQQAQKAATTVAEIALYEGPDRMQRLVEGAKREGELTIYETVTPVDFKFVSDAFTKKYGIKLKIWRSSSENLLGRIVAEQHAGRFEIDAVETVATEMEALHREKVLQMAKSPELAHQMPQAIRPHGEWVGHAVVPIVQGYNPKIVNKEELPKSYQDLLDPRWKGRLGIEAADEVWFGYLSQALGEEKAHKLFGSIVATNGVSVRKGHSLLTNLVAAGEVPLALNLYAYSAENARQKGSPVEWFVMPPAIASFLGVGVMKTAPHPYAAMLFYDFMLGEEGQRILASRNYLPTNNKVERPMLKNVPLTLIDTAHALDMEGKWGKAFEEIFTKRTKQ